MNLKETTQDDLLTPAAKKHLEEACHDHKTAIMEYAFTISKFESNGQEINLSSLKKGIDHHQHAPQKKRWIIWVLAGQHICMIFTGVCLTQLTFFAGQIGFALSLSLGAVFFILIEKNK